MFTGRARHTELPAERLDLERDGVVDDAFNHYLSWRRKSATCESAYRRWTEAATSRESAAAFAAYTAAVDREERAATQYAAALHRG